MKALFLCGGIGKRMFPLVENKLLLNFVGKPLLQHQIEQIMGAGLNRFVLVANPQNLEELERISRAISGAEIEFAIQEKPLGIANAIESAEMFLEDEMVVVNPNDVFNSSAYTSLLQARNNGSASSYILGYEVKDYFPGGYLVTDSSNKLERIIEKPVPGEEPSNLVNILVHLHTDIRKLLKLAKNVQSERDDIYECAIDSMISEGDRIDVVPYNNFWFAIKYPWHVLTMVKYFLEQSEPYISPSAKISPKSTIEGKVIIGDNVRVLEHAVIRGPAYIGDRSIIGNNALVRDNSHIGEDCVVGYCTEVKGSYIGNKGWFHSNYIGDSIIADGCSFGAGTVLANFRFDEGNISTRVGGEMLDTGMDKFGAIIGSNSKTGINSSILPGIKIGPSSCVGPGVCLTKDLEPNKMIFTRPQHITLDNKIELDENNKSELMERLGDL